jgi:hypothetical protein
VAQALPSNVDGQYQTPYDYKGKIGQRKAVKGKRAERQCIQNNSIHSFTHCLLRAIVFTIFKRKRRPELQKKCGAAQTKIQVTDDLGWKTNSNNSA